MKLEQAKQIAERWLELLKPYTERIEIAGSIRREKPEVKDIELVCVPRMDSEPDMFGTLRAYNTLNRYILENAVYCTKNGDRYKQIVTGVDIKLDLFIVLPPAQWGVIFLIRTGSAQYSHRFVTPKREGGLLPSHMKVANGALLMNGKPLMTPEEIDVFRLAGAPWVEPKWRTA